MCVVPFITAVSSTVSAAAYTSNAQRCRHFESAKHPKIRNDTMMQTTSHTRMPEDGHLYMQKHTWGRGTRRKGDPDVDARLAANDGAAAP